MEGDEIDKRERRAGEAGSKRVGSSTYSKMSTISKKKRSWKERRKERLWNRREKE